MKAKEYDKEVENYAGIRKEYDKEVLIHTPPSVLYIGFITFTKRKGMHMIKKCNEPDIPILSSKDCYHMRKEREIIDIPC